MNDTLRYFRHEPIHRKYHHDELTFSLIYAFHENSSACHYHTMKWCMAKNRYWIKCRAICGKSLRTCVCLCLHVDSSWEKVIVHGK